MTEGVVERGDPPQGIRVRPAEERDLVRIHAIEQTSFADPWALAGFRDTLEHARARVEVAVGQDDQVLGYAVAWFVADESEIANLAVAPEARRRHIGLLLLDRILQAAATFGARTVFLEVRQSNVAAQRLYATRGFAVAGRRRHYYRKPVEDALIMRRRL
jgi:ribosomal-protein-alanine N-acetyltransferase